MEIKGFANAISAYKRTSFEQPTKAMNVKTATIRNKDVAEFSSRPENVKSLKAQISNNVNESADASKLNSLREQINDGTYSVTAETILKSIIG